MQKRCLLLGAFSTLALGACSLELDRRDCLDHEGRTYAVAAERLAAVGFDEHSFACGDPPIHGSWPREERGACPEGPVCYDDFRGNFYHCILIRLESATRYCRAIYAEEP